MTPADRFAIGTSISHVWPVHDALTVQAHGSIDIPVLATPHLIFMLEDTCVLAIKKLLNSDEITVGLSVHVDHLASARVGEQINVLAELVSVRGKRLVFRVEGRSGKVVVGRGLHERALVNTEEFLAATAPRSSI
jgi:predicted thioesterase